MNDEESRVSQSIYAEGFGLSGAAEIRDFNHVCSCLFPVDMITNSIDDTDFYPEYLEINVELPDNLCPRGPIDGDSLNG